MMSKTILKNTLEIFPWNDNFSVGIPEIDVQHRKLVQLLNGMASDLIYKSDEISLRIPVQTGHAFHGKLDSHSRANWTLIPRQTGQ
jgi:hypothetical protein